MKLYHGRVLILLSPAQEPQDAGLVNQENRDVHKQMGDERTDDNTIRL